MQRFQQTQFLQSASNVAQLAKDSKTQVIEREVAFAGRSNAGKSSTINALCSQKNLARVSKTPGRTQLINLFQVPSASSNVALTDLPGYGYAKVTKSVREDWEGMVSDYLQKRTSLVGMVLIMDCRHPLQPTDQMLLKWCEARQIPTHVLLNKADKLRFGQAKKTLLSVSRDIEKNYQLAVSLQLFSAAKREGLEGLEDFLKAALNLS